MTTKDNRWACSVCGVAWTALSPADRWAKAVLTAEVELFCSWCLFPGENMTREKPGSCDPDIKAALAQMSVSLADATANLAAATADIATLSKRLEEMQLAMSGGHPAQVAEATLRVKTHGPYCECYLCNQERRARSG